MAPARPTSWRRCPSWRRAAACGAPGSTRSAAARAATSRTPPPGRSPPPSTRRTGRLAIGTGLEPGRSEGGPLRRAVRIDGRPAPSQTALGQHVAAVWLTPQLDRLFLDGPGERRRFLDRLVTALHPQHAGDAAAYDNALRQRSRLLAEGGRDPHWFTALEDTMARHGVALAANRADTVQRLDAAARLGVGPFPRAALAMAGEIDDWLASHAGARRRGPPARRARRQPLARCRVRHHILRAASQRSGGAPSRSRPAGGRGVDRPAEGAPGVDRAGACPAGGPVARLARRCCCSTRSRPISMPSAARRCSTRWWRSALQSWMTGTDAELFAPLGGRAQILRVADGSIAAV